MASPEQVGHIVTLGAIFAEQQSQRQLLTEMVSELRTTREDLIEHKAEDRAMLAAHTADIRTLSHWRSWLAGGLAALGLVVVVGTPVAITWMGP